MALERDGVRYQAQLLDGTPVTFEWTKKYAISIEDGVMYVRVKIKLQNMQGPRPATGSPQPAVGPAVPAVDDGGLGHNGLLPPDGADTTRAALCPGPARGTLASGAREAWP